MNIKQKDITHLIRQLAIMTNAGVPFVMAIKSIIHNCKNAKLKNILNNIKMQLEKGLALSDAIKNHSKYFDHLCYQLIFAGEQSGSLEKMLNCLANHREKTASIKKKIKKALMYPAIVLTIALSISFALLTLVVPQFQEMFAEFGAKLPELTQIIINLSSLIRQDGWMLPIATCLFFVMTKALLKRSKKAKLIWDKNIFTAPVFGDILLKATIANISQIIFTLLASGMNLHEALSNIEKTCKNSFFTKAISQIKQQITAGTTLAQAFSHTKCFPNQAVQMIAVGEQSGTLDEMLKKISSIYEADVKDKVDNLSTLLEPLLMGLLGLLVGGLVIAMYLPIFQMGSAM